MAAKRKASSGFKFYAVRAGHKTGVFMDWPSCQESVTGFKGAVFKSFPTEREAEDFVSGKVAGVHVSSSSTTSTKTPSSKTTATKEPRFYGIAAGHTPGVYTDWSDAQEQIVGYKQPKYKKFATLVEAVEFVQKTIPGFVYDGAEESEEPPRKRVKKDGDEVGSESRVVVEEKEGKEDDGNRPLKIYTDGSSLGNGKLGAVAGVGVYFGPNDPRNVSAPLQGTPQTNQRAELTAALLALQLAPVSQPINILTDSNYTINCATTWCISWEKNNWTTSQGKPVMNKDLVVQIRAKLKEREANGASTEFTWIKGHANEAGNVAADELAVRGARRAQAELRAQAAQEKEN